MQKKNLNMKKILIVDLDETLILSDLLHETFWSSFSINYKISFKSIIWLLKGKAYLKKKLSIYSDISVENLTYNKTVIDYIKQHRIKGGYVALVTGSNQLIAEKIAKHLNLFDEVKGSSEKINLTGKTKAKFLNSRFGYKNYDYIGDSFHDLHVWKNANKAITINTNPIIKRACEKINTNYFHLKTNLHQNSFLEYIKMIRRNFKI